MNATSYDSTSRIQQIASIFWPSFLCAGLLTTIVFTVADPAAITTKLSRTAIYSIGFFFFWLVCACACAGTGYMLKPVPERITQFHHSSDNDMDDVL